MSRSKYQQEIEDAQEVLVDAMKALGFNLSVGEHPLVRVAWMLRNRALAQADSLERIRARSRNEREKLAAAEEAWKATQGRLRQADKGVAELAGVINAAKSDLYALLGGMVEQWTSKLDPDMSFPELVSKVVTASTEAMTVNQERRETIKQLHGRAIGAEKQVDALEGSRRVDAVTIGRLRALLNRLADSYWKDDLDNLAELKKPKT